jgi:membrane protein DedA with SNARE-associated domain
MLPVHRLLELVIHYGIPLVALNVFLEQIGAPIPAVPTLVIAGALSRDGRMSSTQLILVAMASSLVADWIWFALGRRSGYRVLRVLCRISLSPDSCVRDTEANFERWGLKSLLVAKFIPGFSTVAPPLAGATGQSTLQFLIYDGLGAFIWAGTSVAVGRTFHRGIDRVLAAIESLGWWGLVFILAVLALVVGTKWFQRRRFLRELRGARITVAELKSQLDEGQRPVIVDARTESGRKRDPRIVPSALVLDDAQLSALVRDLPPTREIVLYCT